MGIHPDDPVAEARQGFHGVGEHLGISTVEPVGADHDDPASGEAAPGVVAHEGGEAVADPGSSVPVEDLGGGLGHRLVGATAIKLPGDAGEAGAEAEHLDATSGAPCGVGELEQVAGVVRH